MKDQKSQSFISSIIDLCKPRIVILVMFTTAAGFVMASGGIQPLDVFICTLIGTAFTAVGGAILNNVIERHYDALMERTAKRALPQGVITPGQALGAGVLCVLIGVGLLIFKANLLCGFLALLTAFIYVVIYTPLKRVTWLNTCVGAIPGALPPMGGWVAASGQLELGAWLLFLLLFVWQHPHFFAIAWIYKEDYRRGGYKMLSVIDEDGKRTFRQIVVYLSLLIPVSLLPAYFGISSQTYLLGAFALGLPMLATGFIVSKSHSIRDARLVVKTSVIYLPLLLLLIIVDSSLY